MLSTTKFNKKVKLKSIEKLKSERIAVFDDDNFIGFTSKRDLDNILYFETIYEAYEYLKSTELKAGILAFVRENKLYYYFDSEKNSWIELLSSIDSNNFLSKIKDNVVSEDFRISSSNGSCFFSFGNNGYSYFKGSATFSFSNNEILDIKQGYGVVSNVDYSNVDAGNKLIFAQRQYVDNAVNSISFSASSLQKVLEVGNESVNGVYKIKIDPSVITISKSNSDIYNEIRYNETSIKTSSNESCVSTGIKDNSLPYHFFMLNGNTVSIYPNNEPIEKDIILTYPLKSGRIALTSDYEDIKQWVRENFLSLDGGTVQRLILYSTIHRCYHCHKTENWYKSRTRYSILFFSGCLDN